MEGDGSGKAQGSYCFVTCSGQQGIQKVLDVRFHPGGAPQLVVSCNEVGPLALCDPIIPLPQYKLLNSDSQWGWICNQVFLSLHS
jgi:hypothetical protein